MSRKSPVRAYRNARWAMLKGDSLEVGRQMPFMASASSGHRGTLRSIAREVLREVGGFPISPDILNDAQAVSSNPQHDPDMDMADEQREWEAFVFRSAPIADAEEVTATQTVQYESQGVVAL